MSIMPLKSVKAWRTNIKKEGERKGQEKERRSKDVQKINGIKIVMWLQFEGECVMIDIVGNI